MGQKDLSILLEVLVRLNGPKTTHVRECTVVLLHVVNLYRQISNLTHQINTGQLQYHLQRAVRMCASLPQNLQVMLLKLFGQVHSMLMVACLTTHLNCRLQVKRQVAISLLGCNTNIIKVVSVN